VSALDDVLAASRRRHAADRSALVSVRSPGGDSKGASTVDERAPRVRASVFATRARDESVTHSRSSRYSYGTVSVPKNEGMTPPSHLDLRTGSANCLA